jgi:hypothetical protein
MNLQGKMVDRFNGPKELGEFFELDLDRGSAPT